MKHSANSLHSHLTAECKAEDLSSTLKLKGYMQTVRVPDPPYTHTAFPSKQREAKKT